MKETIPCRLCGAPTVEIGHKLGTYSQRSYAIHHCPACHFSFVANMWTEFEKIYSAEYYSGRGADPLVDYMFELDHPEETVRRYEWSGIVRAVKSLASVEAGTQWLDFGCGNGGLVRYVRERESCNIVGFEEGWIREKVASKGIPILDKLQDGSAAFDIVTAIEVFEHVPNPLDTLRTIRSVMKTGGLLFLTTGNAKPFRGKLLKWRYVVPEIHVSFFEPKTMAQALASTGFRPESCGYLPGFTDIIRFKVLKNLGLHHPSVAEQAIPWGVVARLINLRLGISAHPIGRAVIHA